MQYQKSHKRKKRNKVVLLLCAFVFLGGLALALELLHVTDFYQKKAPVVATETAPTINYNPPTQEEKKAGDEAKKTITDKEEVTATKPTNAEVVVVDASQYDQEIEVRAFVANVLEQGTCTFEFSLNGYSTITKESPAYPDASTTPCVTLTMQRSEFPGSGSWQLTITYESASIKGSTQKEIVIQ